MPVSLLNSLVNELESEGISNKHLQFLQALTIFHPSLKLSLPPKGGIDSVITALLSQLRHDQPEAGPVYWSHRCWALVYWQPIYLAVYSVHRHNSWISFKDFQLGFNGKQTSGFYFSNSNWLKESNVIRIKSNIIQHQALELKTLLDTFFSQLSSVIKINTINAWRLVADCILLVILEFEEFSNEQKIDYSYQWLRALKLYDKRNTPHSQLKVIHKQKTCYNKKNIDQDKTSQLVLDRKSCCMHFLIDAKNPCDTCNKY